MGITRQQLYDELWAEPALKVAARHGVSSSYLVRVCDALNVPRPPRGYWAQREFGKAPKPTPLPAMRPGDETEWTKGAALPPLHSRRPPAPAVANADPEARHPLVAGAAELFEIGRVTDTGYLRPRKHNLVDVFVSKRTLGRALDVANELFHLLERRGHRVLLDSGYHQRPRVDTRENAKKPLPEWVTDSWRPGRLTVVHIGDLGFGLTLYELSEEAEVQSIDGKYVRTSEVPVPKHRGWQPWTGARDMPSGRLAFRAFALGVEWQREWREKKAGELPTKFKTIARELVAAVPEVQQLVEQRRVQWERERKDFEEQQRRWRKEEAERKRHEAFKAGRDQLLAIVDKWALARNIEQFFADVEQRAGELAEEERRSVLARLESARRMLGGTDALKRFKGWVSPRERLRASGAEDEEL